MRLLYAFWHFLSRLAARVMGPRVHAFLFDVYRLFLRGEYWPTTRTANLPLRPGHHFLAVCAIIKDEETYLVEWIEFHRLMGVEKFYLYLNDCTDGTAELLKPYVNEGVVEMVVFNGEKMQLPAYRDCVRRHALDTEWLSFIDIDEFIVPTTGHSLRRMLLSQPDSCNQLLLKWLYFGSNGQETRGPGLVIERFTRRGDGSILPVITKSVFRPRKVYEVGAHCQFVVGRSGATRTLPYDVLRIHHYYCKSWQEYSRRATRGCVARGKEYARVSFTRQRFRKYDLNEVEDSSARVFIETLKLRMEERKKGDVV